MIYKNQFRPLLANVWCLIIVIPLYAQDYGRVERKETVPENNSENASSELGLSLDLQMEVCE